jgi:predicted nucleic acid-binding protein
LLQQALEHGLAMVSRNVRDFEPFSLELVDPWELI